MLKRKYIIGILLVLLMTCVAVSAVDDVSAAKYKKFDSGQIKTSDESLFKYSTSYNGKTVKMTNKIYAKEKNKYAYLGTVIYYLTKTNKKNLKMTIVISSKGFKTKKSIEYHRTNLSAKSYYNKILKRGLVYL